MTEDELLELIDMQMAVVYDLQDRCMAFIDDDELPSGDWFSLVMSSQFKWLYQKLSTLWRETTDFEYFLARTRPQYGIFTPSDFEELTQSIMFLVFGKYYETTKGSHDEGIDLILNEEFKTNTGMNMSMTSIVQCKMYRNPVPVSELRDFFGVMVSRAATGYFFTTSSLSNQAIERFLPLANSSSMANKIHVVIGCQLRQLFDFCEVMADELLDSFQENRPLDERLYYNEREKALRIIQDNPLRQSTLF